MKLSQLGEFSLIEEIRRATPVGRGVRIGIGDDAAWVDSTLGSSLVTADLLVEGVHFNLKWTSMFELGYKSLAVNLSDIAAMGGVPGYVILSLGIPAHFDSKQVARFYQGIFALAKPNRVSLVGGDTNVAKSLTISVCVIGHAPYPHFEERRGLEMALIHKPDLILMDLAMPILNGFDSTIEIRKIEYLADTPILCLTAFGDLYDDKARAAGCNDVLQKPIDFGKLDEILEQHIR